MHRFALLLLFPLGILWSLPLAAQGGPGMAVAVETVRLAPEVLSAGIDAVGSLRAENSITLRPELPGRVEKIHFEEGRPVKKGATLFSIDANLLRADQREAEANLALSRRNHERGADLFARKLISQSDHDELRSRLQVDEARLASVRTKMAATQLRAPFDGVMGLRQVSVGEYVTPGQALASLVSLDPIQVEFRVPEMFLGQLAAGQRIDVQLDAFGAELHPGKVTAIDPEVDPGARNVTLRAAVDNPGLKLRPGMFARVQLRLGADQQALMVPEQAIWPVGTQKYVYRVEDGVARMVAVVTGERRTGKVRVVDGLSAGDEVVIAGQLKLRDGAPVSTKAADGAAPSAQPGGS